MVYVVVDRSFGERLSTLPVGAPVWIVDSTTNTPVAQRLWKERPQRSHLTGITTFKADAILSPDSALLWQLDTIELHHGPYSADPPYTQLEVIGTPLSDKVRTELREYGSMNFSQRRKVFFAPVRHRQSSQDQRTSIPH